MDTHYTYLLVHLASLAGPLALSFDKKVHFYKKWKYVFPSMLLSGLFFVCWDEYFTRSGIWGFNENYILGIFLGNLPLEEVLFFITVPYCCLFIYECIRSYFPDLKNRKWADYILMTIAVILLLSGAWHFQKIYTACIFILCAAFMTCIIIFRNFFKSFDSAPFLVSYLIILIPFLFVNGVLTAFPVVWYNDAETLGVRIFSFLPHPMQNIPFEDVIYGMLLIMVNVAVYERLKSSSKA